MDWTRTADYPKRRLASGTTLFQEGDFGDSMYLVVSGNLQVSKRVIEGAEKVLTTLGPGQYVGEMSMLTGAQRSATVQALVDTEVIEVNEQAFMQLLHDYPQVGFDVMQQMAHRLQSTNEELMLTALEMALVQRDPRRRQTQRTVMRFVAVGSVTNDHLTTVLRRAAEQEVLTKNPALVMSLVRPGRTHEALIYIIETDNPRDILELMAPFVGLVQWDVTPAMGLSEALAVLAPSEQPPMNAF
jgi:CRP-like cAMP-binding protein